MMIHTVAIVNFDWPASAAKMMLPIYVDIGDLKFLRREALAAVPIIRATSAGIGKEGGKRPQSN